jgi:hypothetical protein
LPRFFSKKRVLAFSLLLMISPNIEQTSAAVALHYDELDEFYRYIWGGHALRRVHAAKA